MEKNKELLAKINEVYMDFSRISGQAFVKENDMVILSPQGGRSCDDLLQCIESEVQALSREELGEFGSSLVQLHKIFDKLPDA